MQGCICWHNGRTILCDTKRVGGMSKGIKKGGNKRTKVDITAVPFSAIQFLCRTCLQQISGHRIKNEKQCFQLKFRQMIRLDGGLIGHDITTGGGELWFGCRWLVGKRAREGSIERIGGVEI